MKPWITIFSATVLLMFASCDKMEQPIGFDGDVSESQIVMQSHLTAGDSMAIRLCYSRFFLDSRPFRMIDNATFVLKVNGSPVALNAKYSTDDCRYHFDFAPAPGDVLDITVNVPGHDPVTAHTVMPQKPTIVNTTIVDAGMTSENQDHQYVVNFRLKDPADETNYYFITFEGYVDEICQHQEINHHNAYDTIYVGDTVYVVGPYTVFDTVIIYDTSTVNISPSFTCHDYLIAEPSTDLVGGMGESYFYSELYFDDSKINGLNHEIQLTLLINDYYLGNYSSGYLDDYYGYLRCNFDTSTLRLRMNVTSFSRDLYLYDQTTESIESYLGGILSEPVQIHCNVEGGIGIFAGKTTVEIPLKINNESPNTDN